MAEVKDARSFGQWFMLGFTIGIFAVAILLCWVIFVCQPSITYRS